MQKCLITGACGFVGSHLLDYLLKKRDWDFVILDKLSYAGKLSRLKNLKNYDEKRVKFVWHDLRAPLNEFIKEEIGTVDYILHLAANSSVEDTIKNPLGSVYDNVIGTVNLLEFARTQKNLKLFNMFSTDEVMGPAPEGINWTEEAWHRPSNPYSAGKAGAEDYTHAYYITYHLPVFITNTMNVFGEDQHPEKFIPTVIRKVDKGEVLPVYSNKEKTKAGSRFWIHAEAVADAINFLLDNAVIGERYNIVGTEKDNLDLAKDIAKIIGKELKYEFVDFHSSRPGHDLRYGMSGDKLAKMGWELPYTINEYLEQTVRSYLETR